jgi:SPP1 gp7 family putative phage head morphogenesis protein
MSRNKLKSIANSNTQTIQPVAQAKPSMESIFAKIVEQVADLSRKDIKKWRNALQAYLSNPESSTLYALQQIYADLMMDGHLSSQILLRKASILNTPYNALVNDKIDENLTKLFNQSEWVYNLTDLMLDSIFTGTEVVEFKEVVDNIVNWEAIPKTNTNPKFKKIFPDAYDISKFIQYDTPELANRIIQIGKDTNIGILNNIVPQLIWSRFAEQSWSEFCERFGLPFVTVTTNKTQKSELDKIDSKVKNFGQNLSLTMPTGTMVDIKQAGATDAYKVFMERINKCEEKISKQIVGGTMISDNGSSRSQSEVHERNLDDKITLMDARFVESAWNFKIIPLLRARGFKIPENTIIKFDNSEKQEIKLTDIDINQYELDPQWLEKTYGVVIVGKKEKSIEPPKPAPKTKAETSPFNTPSAEIHAEAYTGACQECGGSVSEQYSATANTLVNSIRTRFVDFAKKLFDGKTELVDSALLTNDYASLFNDGVNQNFDWIGIDYDTEDAVCRQAMELNLFQFSSAKTLSATIELNKALYDGEKKRSWSDFKAQADAINTEYNTNWLRAEYNHAVAVGQSSSTWFKMWNEREDIPFMEYQTIGDSQVRDSHALLNGTVYRIDDKDAQKIFPPNGWNCRCEMLQYTGSNPTLANAKESGQIIKDQQKGKKDFLINFADTKEVFTQNQMTLKNVTHDLLNVNINNISNVTFEDYGLEKNPRSKTKIKTSNHTIQEVADRFITEKDKNYKILKDYSSRQIKLFKRNFLDHIGFNKSKKQAKYISENRHLLYENIQDVLDTPNEVWLNAFEENNKPTLVYVKYYNDQVLIVKTGLQEKKQTEIFSLETWFKNEEAEAIRKEENFTESRRGLRLK